MMFNGETTWVVIADSSKCRVYQYKQRSHKVHLIREVLHPENQLKDSDYMSDRQGSFKGGGAGHGTFLANGDPKKIKIDQFAQEIANSLDVDRKNNAFEHLILVSPPHMNGLLHQHFSKHILRKLDLSIDKSVINFPKIKLLKFLDKCTHIH